MLLFVAPDFSLGSIRLVATVPGLAAADTASFLIRSR